MLIRQHAHFSLTSDRTPASEIAGRLGLAPDTVRVRGSKRPDPPRPVSHAWEIVCREPGLPVDDLITRIVDRLAPHASAIGRLTAGQPDITATMAVVRYLDDDEGEPEDPGTGIPGFVRLAGQHQLLGWHLDRRTLDFLQATGAELDIDEYG